MYLKKRERIDCKIKLANKEIEIKNYMLKNYSIVKKIINLKNNLILHKRSSVNEAYVIQLIACAW